MDHLEANRTKNTLKRSMQMSDGLQKFTNKRPLQSEADPNLVTSAEPDNYKASNERQSPPDLGQPLQPPEEPTFTTEPRRLEISEKQHQKHTPPNPFLEAATIIRESLLVDSCAFFSGDSLGLHFMRSPQAEDQYESSNFSPSVSSNDGENDSPTAQSQIPCQMLGCSSSSTSDLTKLVGGLSQPFLSHLLQQYPEGCIFDFDSRSVREFDRPKSPNAAPLESPGASAATASSNTSSDENPLLSKLSSRSDNTTAGSIYEQKELLQTFPGVRNVTFIPVWDPQKGVSSIGAFVCSKTPFHEFDRDRELPFLRALGILAASEAFRLETSAADKAKSDVLGSISHELRSPLHGITLGLELLNDSGLGTAQRNITHMIETCCRTLLDTTEHLLDYSKVNQPSQITKSNEEAPKQPNIEKGTLTRAGDLTRAVHLDRIVEDAMESVYAGHNYQQLSIAQMFSPSKTRKNSDGVDAIRRLDSVQAAEEVNPTRNGDEQRRLQNRDVSVFLLYDPTSSWHFRTLPGAIRRITMNLFGNSLKYTSQGVIKVSISQSQPEHAESNERTVTLIVQDTGRGISEEFLRHTVFKPFSQEDQLSTGTGLGLSFVQRITSQLGGSISVSSQIDMGTKVTVSLPMTLEREPLRNEPVKKQSACHGLRAQMLSAIGSSEVSSAQRAVTRDALMERLCCEHLGMRLTTNPSAEHLAPDVAIQVNNAICNLSEPAVPPSDLPVLVVCNNTLAVQRHERIYESAGRQRLHEFISQP
ncbi:hypothetical protein ACHAPJ_009738 [Fusarium lateritium]